MDFPKELLSNGCEVRRQKLDTLRVNLVGTGQVVLLLDVGELVGQALTVEVLFRVGSLVEHDLPWDDNVLVAGLLAGALVIEIGHVAFVEAEVVERIHHLLVDRLDTLEVLFITSFLHLSQ